MKGEKPLGIKSYGSIGHLPGSRMGPDRGVHSGQAAICTVDSRDKNRRIVVLEKLDGTNVGVANIDGNLVPLTRVGYRAEDSPYLMHHMFAKWVYENYERFLGVVLPGERLCGEWLVQAHGTRYDLPHEPFVAFDLMHGHNRATYEAMLAACEGGKFVTPRLISYGPAYSIENALKAIETSGHGALDPVEGAVWRVERKDKVEFLAKYVRHDKVDGIYLEGNPVWNNWPGKEKIDVESI